MRSNAPCLMGTRSEVHGKAERCWEPAINGTGYCERHQRPPFEGTRWDRPKNWERLRQIVMLRDKTICHICGEPGSDQIDHITPLSMGGSNLPYNLAPIHSRVAPHCHRKKTAEQANELKKLRKQQMPRRGGQKSLRGDEMPF